MSIKTNIIEHINAMDDKDVFLQQVYELIILKEEGAGDADAPDYIKSSLEYARKQIDNGEYVSVEEFKEK